MNFSDSFFENSNYIQIANKFEALSININGIRGKNLVLSSFLKMEDPDIIAIQEIKIDRNILTSELCPDNFNYDVYRNDRILNGGGVNLLVNKTCLIAII